MTAPTATRSARNAKACVAKGDRCVTHDAIYPETAAQIGAPCWGTGKPKPASEGAKRILAELKDAPADADGMAHVVVQLPVREPASPDPAPTCEGSNHVPGCAHFAQAPAAFPPAAGASLLDLPLDLVDVGDNVRVEIEGLEELAASIAEHGVLQPIKATGPHADGRYLVTWGQRRTVASRMAGQTTIPAIVLAPDAEVDKHGSARSIEQLVENLHRKDLPALDRARAMREVVDAGTSQADLARKLGVDASTVANSLRLLDLDEEVQRSIAAGLITAAHGKSLVGLAPKTQRELVKRAASEGASAHRMEAIVAAFKRGEQWQKERDAQERKAAEASREKREQQIAGMGKKKIPLDAPIHVSTGYYGGSGKAGHVVELLKRAGYTNVLTTDRGLQGRPSGVGCDCTDWKVEIQYDGGLAIGRACIVRAHWDAKAKADEAARSAGWARQTAVTERVKQFAPGQVAVSPYASDQLLVDMRFGRMLLWELLGYGAADWAVAKGGKRNQPWQAVMALTEGELADEIALQIAKGFRDHSGYHVDWDQVADMIGMAEAAS